MWQRGLGKRADSIVEGVLAWFVANAAIESPTVLKRLHGPMVRRIVFQATGMWLATRVALVTLTFLAATFGLTPDHLNLPTLFQVPEQSQLLQRQLAGQGVMTNWVHFDAGWYLIIGLYGYDYQTAISAGWFPLYSAAIHLVTLVVGADQAFWVALALSNIASLFAFIGLGLLGTYEAGGAEETMGLVTITAAYPLAFYLFAPFSEGFFLAFAVFALYFARIGCWWQAAICAFFAGLTRPTAVALVLPFAWEYGRQHGLWQLSRWRAGGWRTLLTRRAAAMGALAVAAVPIAIGTYMLFLKIRYGGALLYQHAQANAHGHVNVSILTTANLLLHRFINPPAAPVPRLFFYIDAGSLIVFTILALAGVRRLPFMYTLYMFTTIYLLASVPVPHHPQVVTSSARYMIGSIPVFLLLSWWAKRRPWLEMLLVGGGFLIQALFAIAYLYGFFIE